MGVEEANSLSEDDAVAVELGVELSIGDKDASSGGPRIIVVDGVEEEMEEVEGVSEESDEETEIDIWEMAGVLESLWSGVAVESVCAKATFIKFFQLSRNEVGVVVVEVF